MEWSSVTGRGGGAKKKKKRGGGGVQVSSLQQGEQKKFQSC